MEKKSLIYLCLILLGFGGFAAEFKAGHLLNDSIGKPSTDAFYTTEKTDTTENYFPFEYGSFPDKNPRDKKKSSRNGLYVELNNQGDTQFVVQYKRGQLNGEWTSWFNNRNVCDSGLLVNDVADGTWKGWYANGNPKYILHFSAKKLNELKSELLRKPKIKYFILSSMAASDASRHYDARLLFGHKTSSNPAILLSRQVNLPGYSNETLKNIVNENTSGESNGFYAAPFTEGLLHGPFTSFYPNGKIKQTGLYLNGLREGIWEEFNAQNEKAVGTYKHGYRNGEWRYYSPGGKLLYWKRFDAKGKESEKFNFTNRNA